MSACGAICFSNDSSYYQHSRICYYSTMRVTMCCSLAINFPCRKCNTTQNAKKKISTGSVLLVKEILERNFVEMSIADSKFVIDLNDSHYDSIYAISLQYQVQSGNALIRNPLLYLLGCLIICW